MIYIYKEEIVLGGNNLWCIFYYCAGMWQKKVFLVCGSLVSGVLVIGISVAIICLKRYLRRRFAASRKQASASRSASIQRSEMGFNETSFYEGTVWDQANREGIRGRYASIIQDPYAYNDLYLPGDVHTDLHASVSLSYDDVRLPKNFQTMKDNSMKPRAANLDQSSSSDDRQSQPYYLTMLPSVSDIISARKEANRDYKTPVFSLSTDDVREVKEKRRNSWSSTTSLPF